MTTQERIDYYRNNDVRERIAEFLGGDTEHVPTCRYVVAGDELAHHVDQPQPITALDSLLDQGLEVSRSLWDDTSIIADFDIEYVNFDYPAEAFLAPERVFQLLEPVANEIEAALRDWEIPALKLLSGRGHHFVWRIRRGSTEFNRLVQLGRGPEPFWPAEEQLALVEGRQVPGDLVRAFSGLGLLMEFLAHRVKEKAAPQCTIPVELTALEVGPSARGREMISLDISEYGDPLSVRTMRAAFSVYLKPWQQRWIFDPERLKGLPPFFVVPLGEQSWREGVRAMRDAAATVDLAANCSAVIPDATASLRRLLNDYEASGIGKFHRWFYSEEQYQPNQWEDTYDRLPLDLLPACVRMNLEQPNDLLLRPGHIRRLVRVMLALGWHPRHIAGLIYSRYARPFGWTQFEGCDRAMRAEFYTRIFAGAFATGYDDLIDFNCVSTQEQKACAFSDCGFNLLDFRQSALNRRTHDKLANRPFNRLFLQPEYS